MRRGKGFSADEGSIRRVHDLAENNIGPANTDAVWMV
jgi:hypothetical protein